MWKLLTDLSKRLGKRPEVSLRTVANGIYVESSDSRAHRIIRWDDIDEIHAFKLDLGTIDEIRLAIHDSSGWHELSEQDHGFMDVVAELQHRIPSIHELWYLEVMLPAFERNQRVLWRRSE